MLLGGFIGSDGLSRRSDHWTKRSLGGVTCQFPRLSGIPCTKFGTEELEHPSFPLFPSVRNSLFEKETEGEEGEETPRWASRMSQSNLVDELLILERKLEI